MPSQLQEIYVSETANGKKIQIFVDERGVISGEISYLGEVIPAKVKGEGIPKYIDPSKIDKFKKDINENRYCTALFNEIIIEGRIRGGFFDPFSAAYVGYTLATIGGAAVVGVGSWLWSKSTPSVPSPPTPPIPTTASPQQSLESSEHAKLLENMESILKQYDRGQEEKISSLTQELKNQSFQHLKSSKIIADQLLFDQTKTRLELEQRIIEFEDNRLSLVFSKKFLLALDEKYPFAKFWVPGTMATLTVILIAFGSYAIYKWKRTTKENIKLNKMLNKLMQKDIIAAVSIAESRVKGNSQWTQKYKTLWSLNRGVSQNKEESYWSNIGAQNAYENIQPENITTDEDAWKLKRKKFTTYIMPADKKDNGKGVVFIKALPVTTDEGKQEEQRREIEILTGLHSPWIVSCFGVIEQVIDTISYHCLVMELAICSLDILLIKALPPTFIYQIALEIAEGLCVLSAQPKPIVHRDLKPHNILLGRDYHIRLADFGLSKKYPNTEQVGASQKNNVGTPSYAAPEAFPPAAPGVYSDMYSFGLVLWSLLKGEILTLSARKDSNENLPPNEGEILAIKLSTPSTRYTSTPLPCFKSLLQKNCRQSYNDRMSAQQAQEALLQLNKDFPLTTEDFTQVTSLAHTLISLPVKPEHFANTLGFS